MNDSLRHPQTAFPTSIAILVAFATLQAIEVNFGHLHPLGLAWIVLAMALLVAGLRAEPRGIVAKIARLPISWIAIACLSIQWIQLAMFGVNGHVQVHLPFAWFVVAITVVGFGAGIACCRESLRTVGIAMLVVGHIAAGAYVVRATPKPFLDAWYFQQESADALLHGRNPYEVRYRNIYAPDTSIYSPGICVDGYLTVSNPYPPLTLLVDAVGKVFGDVRWAHLACIELAAVIMALSSKRFGTLAASIFLVSPATLVVLQWGWTEPIVILGLVGTVYCAVRRRNWTWVALGFLIAAKQYGPIFLPLVTLMGVTQTRREAVRLVIRSILLASAITLPFVIWNPAAIFRSVILWQLRQPFRMDCLSFRAMVASLMGYQMPPIVGFVLATAAICWTGRQKKGGLSPFSAAAAFVLLWFFSFGQQAHYNYYFLVIGAACGTVACADVKTEAVVSSTDQTSQQMRLAA